MLHVCDVVNQKKLIFVSETEPVAEAVRHMAENQVGAILVLRKGELRGIFSERDIMTRVVLDGRNSSSTLVRDVMTTDVATIDEMASLEEAMARMQAHHCRHLPVMHSMQVVNFLSMRDLMTFELERKTEEIHQMWTYIQSA